MPFDDVCEFPSRSHLPAERGLAMPSPWFNLGTGKQQAEAYRTSLALGAHI
jgi:hypothetical protein